MASVYAHLLFDSIGFLYSGGTRDQVIRGQRNYSGRIAITSRFLFMILLKRFPILFSKPYFLVSRRFALSASAPARIRALASSHWPSGLPRMSQGTMRTRELFRMRFTLPASASE